jgi:ATP synthase F1 complex assembly factor 2
MDKKKPELYSFKTSSSGRLYEINLDKRKLKTPAGKLFQVDNELLGHIISNEWNTQTDTIKQHTMHLTSLVNTCIDNPNKLTKEFLVKQLNDYLQTDTLLFFDANKIQKLDELQEKKWVPIVNWFNTRFPDLNLVIQREIDHTNILANNNNFDFNNSFSDYLLNNFNLNTLIAFNFIVECLKSVILTVALLERKVFTVEEVCELAFLEQKHQYDQWGKVEWYHDINESESKSRVSAGLLFVYLSNSSKFLVERHVAQASQN